MIQAPDTIEHGGPFGLLQAPELGDAVSLLERLLGGPSFLDDWVPQLVEEARGAEDWYVARRQVAPDGSLSALVFVWPPGTGTKVHDHSSWGALRPLFGTVLEERYERLDDGTVADHARLQKAWESLWSRQDGASTVLPYDGGIHRISNPGTTTAVTVHLYGPREAIDGRDYDPSRDYVCDRRDPDDEEAGNDAQAA